MNQSSLPGWRALWIQAHRWIGVILFAAFAVLGVSGSLLVYDTAAERTLYPGRYPEHPSIAARPVAEYVANASTALPEGDSVTVLRFPITPGGSVLAGGKPQPRARLGPPPRRRIWLNPENAQIAATDDAGDDALWFAHALHGHLMMQGFGRELVGWIGWAMLISCGSGLYLWWPRKGGAVTGLRWRRTASVISNLHYQAGIWLAIPLAALSLTGAYIAMPAAFDTAFNFLAGDAIAGSGPREETAPPDEAPLASPRLSAGQAVAAAIEANRGGRPTLIIWPLQQAQIWRIGICCVEGDDSQHMFLVDDTTRTAVPAPQPPVHAATASDRTGDLLRSIHEAEEFGPVWRVVAFLAGITPALFGVTGVIMWLRGRARRSALGR